MRNRQWLLAALAAATFYAGALSVPPAPPAYGPCPEDAAWIVMPGNDFPMGPNGGRSCITVSDIVAAEVAK